MIILHRYVVGLLPYTTVFFPQPEILRRVPAPRLGLARLFWSDRSLEPTRVIRRDPSATICIDLDRATDELFSDLSKNGRNEIRAVERLGDRVSIEHNSARAERDLLAIYQEFAALKPGVAAFNRRIIARYRDYADLFVAYLDDRPFCGHVLLRDQSVGRARLLYSASRRLNQDENARICGNLNRFLHWREITDYRDKGFALYDLGGIRQDPNDGITRFKKSFGGVVRMEWSYTCAGSAVLALIGRSGALTGGRRVRTALRRATRDRSNTAWRAARSASAPE